MIWKLATGLKAKPRPDNAGVKQFVFEALGRNPDIGISVSEITCADPACPGQETVILVMAPGRKTAACKVSKAMAEVTADDVRDALRQLTYTP